jgi:uncharacterized protein YndB with AHSA1/START domain/DNA-binding transcriptional ArsR family regulator
MLLAVASDTWSALADPQRRAMLDLLLERALPVDELAHALGLSEPEASLHLVVLRSAGLVIVHQDDEGTTYAADAGPLAEVDSWLTRHRGRLDSAPPEGEQREPAAAPAPSDPGPDAPHGSFGTVGRRPALQFALRLRRPVDAVWQAITDPAELAAWFPAAVAADLRLGGEVELVFPGMAAIEGEVTEFEPPRRLGFSVWGSEHLRFELTPEPDGVEGACGLRFMHVLDDRETAARDAAGWHVCLSRLAAALEGRTPLPPESEMQERARLHDEYAQLGLPTRPPAAMPA